MIKNKTILEKILLTQTIDGGTDLESRAQFDIHGRYEMVLSQKQQSLPIYFLGQKLGSQFLTTWTQQKDRTLVQFILISTENGTHGENLCVIADH